MSSNSTLEPCSDDEDCSDDQSCNDHVCGCLFRYGFDGKHCDLITGTTVWPIAVRCLLLLQSAAMISFCAFVLYEITFSSVTIKAALLKTYRLSLSLSALALIC